MTFVVRFNGRNAEIYRLFDVEKLTQVQIAERMGMTIVAVKAAILTHRRRNGIKPAKRGARPAPIEAPEDVEPDGPRCKCGLRLPCNNCIPTARDYAESRLEAPPYVRGIDGYRREPKGGSK